MASSPIAAPPTTPRRTVLNRSVTTPSQLSTRPTNPPPEIGATEGVETLYVAPSVSIIKFTAPAASRPGSSASHGSPGRPQSSSGTLPWVTSTERTVAAGQLEIYRVPGSVSFFRSGTFLHAIMPRSQCWCVDGVSKFVFRAPDAYYRIELPGETEEDRQEVERWKATLKKVLYYERTPCPFARTFEVELPEEQKLEDKLEVKKRRRKSTGPAKKWRLQRGYSWKPEGWVKPENTVGDEESSADADGSGSGSTGGSEDENENASEVEEPVVRKKAAVVESGKVNDLADKFNVLGSSPPPSAIPVNRPTATLRSVTAPAAPQLVTNSPSKLRTRVDVDGTVEVTEPVEEEAEDSEPSTLRTFQAIPTNMPPSPPDSSAGLEYLEGGVQVTGSREGDPRSSSEDATVAGAETEVPKFYDRTATEDDVAQRESDTSVRDADEEPGIVETEVESSQDHVESSQDASTGAGMVPEPARPGYSTPTTPAVQPDEVRPTTPETQPVNSRPVSLDTPYELQQTQQSEAEEPTTTTARPVTPPNKTYPEDPYAAIQARILARRSIGGTIHPTTSRASITSTSSSSTAKSALSRRSNKNQDQALTSALVQKAYSVFLGPPAHLVAIMLKIAARFANGAFGMNGLFYVESPVDGPQTVPGGYKLERVSSVESEDEDWESPDALDAEEDDFGVPLRSPRRLRDSEGLRARRDRGWDVD